MINTDLIDIIVGFFPWGFIQLGALILIGFYAIFAAIIVRQETLMSRVVGIPPLSPVLKVIALGHFFVSILVFFLALVLL